MTDRQPTQDDEAPPPSNEDDWGLDETGELDDAVVEKLPRPPV